MSLVSTETGPETFTMTPGNHFGPWLKFLTITGSPAENVLDEAFSSCRLFICACCFSTFPCKFGCNKSNVVFSFLWFNNSAGLFPVVEWGVSDPVQSLHGITGQSAEQTLLGSVNYRDVEMGPIDFQKGGKTQLSSFRTHQSLILPFCRKSPPPLPPKKCPKKIVFVFGRGSLPTWTHPHPPPPSTQWGHPTENQLVEEFPSLI